MADNNTEQVRAEGTRDVKKHQLLFAVTFFAIVAYIVWRTVFTLPTNYGAVALIFGVLLLVAEIGASFEAVVNYSMLSKYTPPELPVIPESWYPEIDIFIATHNEPVEMLFSTVNACTFLDYPDKSKIHIHLCDDAGRPEMAQLAERFGVNYWGLPDNKNAKGGNLNNALRQTYAPIVVTLDADMIPRHEFLMKTVPYFFLPKMKKDDDGNWIPKTNDELEGCEKVGYVQTPQGFYNPDLFQHNLYSEDRIPGEQDLFFRDINVARSAYNASIYAGSNTLISREALEDVDYIAINTITEDILTGMRIQKLGYRVYATSDLLVQGQAPVSIKGLINQRRRWGRGCVDALRQEPVVFTGMMTFAQKVSYITCWVFWWTYARRAIFLLAPISAILFNLHVVEAELWQVLVFWLPYYLLFNRSLRVMSGDIWNQHWSNVADTILFPYMVGPIIAEQLGIKEKKFKITDKEVTGTTSRATFIFGVPHLVFLIGMILSIGVVISQSIAAGTIYNPIILYWLIIGTKNLLFALFFMWGRDNARLASRFYFSEPVTISSRNRSWEAITSDASESGIAFLLDDPEFIPDDSPILASVQYRGKVVSVLGDLVHVSAAGDRWKYSIHFRDIPEHVKRYYREYVYDRHHSLPTKLDASLSLLDDFNLQLGKRIQPIQDSMRKLPRIPLDIPFTSDEGHTGVFVDFNYRYASLRFEPLVACAEAAEIDVVPGFSIDTRAAGGDTGSTAAGGTAVGPAPDRRLFAVRDCERFFVDEHIAPLLSDLTKKSPREKQELGATAHITSWAITPEEATAQHATAQHTAVQHATVQHTAVPHTAMQQQKPEVAYPDEPENT